MCVCVSAIQKVTQNVLDIKKCISFMGCNSNGHKFFKHLFTNNRAGKLKKL